LVYQPRDHWLWDFWLAPRRSREEPYHLFYLQAPRSLPSYHDRHWVAAVGHAVSHDLVTWEERPTAFGPGPAGSWDDQAIWTGSILDHEGTYHFFYTALHQGEDGRVQRIGLATSTDLQTWQRHPPNPLLEADPRYYRKLGPPPWDWEACRDPWVVYDEARGDFLMLYTASAAGHPHDAAGVVGAARSSDLVAWEPLRPVTEPAEFGMLEVPQPVKIDGRWYLLYCTLHHSATRLARTGPAGGWHGTHYLVGDRLTGPYRLATDHALVGDDPGTYYAGRVVEEPSGNLVFFAWRQWDDAGRFLGALSNPAPLQVLADGTLHVDQAALWPS
jgi:beta-fructofuranosidase